MRKVTSELPLNDDRRAVDFIDCISLWQPWASWIAWGWKTIETRSHSKFERLAGKRIAIHAAQAMDRHALFAASRYLTPEQYCKTRDGTIPSGAILCTVFVQAHRRLTSLDSPHALIDCDASRFGLVFAPDDLLVLPDPIAFRGQMGIFPVPRDLVADAL